MDGTEKDAVEYFYFTHVMPSNICGKYLNLASRLKFS